jgi:hypothetical protein
MPRVAAGPWRSPWWLRWWQSRWRRWRHREDQGVVEPREHPLLLLLSDEDGHCELLLLGELRRHDELLAKVGRLEVVVDDMVDHVVRVVVDHPAVVDLARDLAADTWRRRRRLLGLDTDVVVVFVLVVLVNVVRVIFVIVRVRHRRPIPVPVGVTEVAGVPL